MTVFFCHVRAVIIFCGFGMVATKCAVDHMLVNGILGKPLDLPIGDQQNVSKIILKKKTSSGFRKFLEYDVPTKTHRLNNTLYLNYNERNSTVMFVALDREHKGEYMLVKDFGLTEIPCPLNINVYEQISNLSIDHTIIRHNDTSVLLLNCTTKAGDAVTFSWRRDEEILNHSSNVLQINLTMDSDVSSYICTASNPVSETSISITSNNGKSIPPEPKHSMIIAIVVPAVAVLIILNFAYFQKTRYMRRKNESRTDQSFSLTPPETSSDLVQQELPATSTNTIYSMVQKSPGFPGIPASVQQEPRDRLTNTIYSTIQKTPLPGFSAPGINATSTVYELAGRFVRNETVS